MGKQNRNVMHDAAGKKIMHPADAIRKKAKKKKLEKMKGYRHENFQNKMLQRAPEDILLEIRQLKADHERKRKARIDIHKSQLDRLKQLEVMYEKLKDKIEENHEKRNKEQKHGLHIDFDELKIHRKASIFYHPVNNPYGAPPSGEMLMYRHPDGSVKRQPPAVPVNDAGSMAQDGGGGSDESDDSDEDDSEDDGADPLLPDTLPGMPPAASSAGPDVPCLPPLPPGPPPAPLPLGQPPLPFGQPPLPMGQPPLAFGQPPLPFGGPPLPLGQPPLPAGMPPLPVGQPPLPFGGPPLPMPSFPGSDMSQADFMADLAKAGFQIPGLPPGPPPKPSSPIRNIVPEVLGTPPGPPPKPKAPKARSPPRQTDPPGGAKAERKETVVSEMPAGSRPPPPPPKKPTTGKPSVPKSATVFMPTMLRTKQVSQVAGGVLQATSASLSKDKREKLLASDVPRVSERSRIDDAFEDFMREVG